MRKIPSQRTPWMQGETLMAEDRRKSWQDLIESVDMIHNSKRAWSTIKKINNDPKKATLHSNVTADQVAHQLLLNGKPPHKTRHRRVKRQCARGHGVNMAVHRWGTRCGNWLPEERQSRWPGWHPHWTNQTNQTARKWLLSLFNSCVTLSQLPKIWRKARVIAILKPGKDPHEVKSYRPISLLCHLFKLFERLILNRLGPITEEHLIQEQAGFRPGKSCTGQVLNLTQHFEDGFEKNEPTGVVFVDLTAAMTLSTTDYSSANCMTWRKTSIWQSWSNCFWKTDASMLSWMANKAGGGNNGMAFPRVASLLPCCSISTPMISQYHPEQEASSTLMTLA